MTAEQSADLPSVVNTTKMGMGSKRNKPLFAAKFEELRAKQPMSAKHCKID